MSHQCFLSAESSSSYTFQNKLTVLLTHVLYKEYVSEHIVSVDISGKYFSKTGKIMLISGNARKDEAYQNKQNRRTHSEWRRVVRTTSGTQWASGMTHLMSEGSPGNPHNNAGAGLETTTLLVCLKKTKVLDGAEEEPVVGGCGWGPRWGRWSGQSKPVRALMAITCSHPHF